jgi:uncharacterized protein YceH (UPF0502 family)
MTLKLDAAQRRVLGVLIEKSRTTPGAYPLTLNSLLVGCNQLSCREPVLRLTEDEVAKAARELGAMRLAAEADPGRGSRVERYRHTVEESLQWNDVQQAVLAELLLRGPQTAGELKTNASRMATLPDLDGVLQLLGRLAAQVPPMVRELPRQPGKSVPRYDHLLYAEGEARAEPDAAASVPSTLPSGPLEDRVARLEREVSAFRKELQDLRHMLRTAASPQSPDEE